MHGKEREREEEHKSVLTMSNYACDATPGGAWKLHGPKFKYKLLIEHICTMD